MTESIPLARPDITTEDIAEVTGTLTSGQLSLGPRLHAFEAALAATCGTTGAVGTSSGTAGLELALKAVGVKPGDEVITTSFTFVATANAIHHVGATPVFVDICPDSLNIDPGNIAAAITPRTRAILVVHVFGRLAEMQQICDIAQRHQLVVIEDACEALGTTVNGKAAGSFGDAGVFGFYPNKVITCGEGGAVVSNEDEILDRCRRLRNHGRVTGAVPFDSEEPGHNYRLSEMQAALGVSQLARLKKLVTERARLFDGYQERLASVDWLRTPLHASPGMIVSWFVYVVRVSSLQSSAARERICQRLTGDGIATGHYFPAIHRMKAYTVSDRCRYESLPNTEGAANQVLALPFFPGLTEDQLDRVCESLIRHTSATG
ncbi:MAG: DegT/DnrJ/EryC1/StrS family aminotransferase [Gammaproteobacteria bacterium]